MLPPPTTHTFPALKTTFAMFPVPLSWFPLHQCNLSSAALTFSLPSFSLLSKSILSLLHQLCGAVARCAKCHLISLFLAATVIVRTFPLFLLSPHPFLSFPLYQLCYGCIIITKSIIPLPLQYISFCALSSSFPWWWIPSIFTHDTLSPPTSPFLFARKKKEKKEHLWILPSLWHSLPLPTYLTSCPKKSAELKSTSVIHSSTKRK